MARISENIKINKQPICNGCINHIRGDKCKAFNIIPDIILLGENDHAKPLPGQENNIIYEPLKK